MLLVFVIGVIAAAVRWRTAVFLFLTFGIGLAYWAIGEKRKCRKTCEVHGCPLVLADAWFCRRPPIKVHYEDYAFVVRDQFYPNEFPGRLSPVWQVSREAFEGAKKERVRYCPDCEAAGELFSVFYRRIATLGHLHGERLQALIQTCQQAMVEIEKPWVLFSQGTIIVVEGTLGEVPDKATELLQKHGPFSQDTPLREFDVVGLEENRGWFIGGSQAVIRNVVLVSDIDPRLYKDVDLALLGRLRRDEDAYRPAIVHVVHVE